MQSRTKSFVIGAFVIAVIASVVSAENDHQQDLREMKAPYVRTLGNASDSNN